MVTCKDCIHCRACHEMYLIAVSQEDDFFERNDAETCEDFKDKYSIVEAKHGEWKKGVPYVCSICDNPAPDEKNTSEKYSCWTSPYCPNCGAKMDGRSDT